MVEAAYAGEMFGALRESGVSFLRFCLKVPAEVLSQRLIERHRVRTGDRGPVDLDQLWCVDQNMRFATTAAQLPDDTIFLDGAGSPAELAKHVRMIAPEMFSG